jgi:hypothetical protein
VLVAPVEAGIRRKDRIPHSMRNDVEILMRELRVGAKKMNNTGRISGYDFQKEVS